VNFLIDNIKTIYEKEKNVFWVCVGVNILTFLLFVTSFFMANHTPRFPWIELTDQIHAARWFTPVTIAFLYEANIPVFSHLFSIIVYILVALSTCRFWFTDRPAYFRAIAVLLITLFPASLTIYYYTWMGHQYPVAMLLAISGLMIAKSTSPVRVIVGSILIMCSMGSYQASLSVTATLFMTYCCVQWSLVRISSKSEVKEFLSKIIPMASAVIVGVFLYRVSLHVFGLNEAVVVETITFDDLVARLVVVSKVAFSHLYLTQPELQKPIKWLLAVSIVAAGLTYSINSYRHQKNCLQGILAAIFSMAIFLGCILATKAMFFVSSNNSFFTYRFNFSLGFLYAFSIVSVMAYGRISWIKRAFVLLSIFVLVRYSQANLVRQNVLLKGQQHDIALASRILSRIESLPELEIEKEYILIRTNAYSRFRRDAFASGGRSYQLGGEGHMDGGDIPGIWTPASIMPLLGSKVRWKYTGYVPDFADEIAKARELVIEKNIRPWPHSSSVFIHGDYIYVHIQ
jgi:glucosyltransferase GtrII-like protein